MGIWDLVEDCWNIWAWPIDKFIYFQMILKWPCIASNVVTISPTLLVQVGGLQHISKGFPFPPSDGGEEGSGKSTQTCELTFLGCARAWWRARARDLRVNGQGSLVLQGRDLPFLTHRPSPKIIRLNLSLASAWYCVTTIASSTLSVNVHHRPGRAGLWNPSPSWSCTGRERLRFLGSTSRDYSPSHTVHRHRLHNRRPSMFDQYDLYI